MIEALLFDLDGTLADTIAANVEAYARALDEAGVSVSAATLATTSAGRNWRQFLPPLIEAAGSQAEPAAVASRKQALYREMVGQIRLNQPLLSLLIASHGPLKTALVTTASRTNVDALIDAHGLRSLFDTIVTGDDVTAHKPDPAAYLMASERLGLPPQQCIAFEDSDIGVASARAAGMGVVRIVFGLEPGDVAEPRPDS